MITFTQPANEISIREPLSLVGYIDNIDVSAVLLTFADIFNQEDYTLSMMADMRMVNIRNVIRSKSPVMEKWMPGFLIRYLERIIHQKELNEVLLRYGHLYNQEFISKLLEYMGISYKSTGIDNIPRNGRYIFTSNHPLGGLDGLVFMDEVSKHFNKVKFPVNDILLNIENMSGIFLPVNKHGSQGREAAKAIEEAYRSDSQILYFPAGLCSRRKSGEICDLRWHKSFITKAIQHQRDIVPVYISGRNSNFFYSLSNIRNALGIKANIEMLYLVDEMYKQKGKEISIIFGKPILWQSFDRSRTAGEWASHIKSVVYDMKPT